MGSKTKQLPFENNNEYAEFKVSDTPDIMAARNAPAMDPGLAPTLQRQFDRSQQVNKNRFSNAYNQDVPSAARMAMRQQADRDSAADYGANVAQASDNANTQNFQRKFNLASLTRPQYMQTKGVGFNSQSQPGFLQQLAGGAASAAGSFI